MRSHLAQAIGSFGLLVLLGGATATVSRAADAPAVPATQPVYVAQPSATPNAVPPAANADRPKALPNSIVFIPFVEIGADTQMEWVGRGIQQDLGTDVARGSRLIVVTPTGASPANDPDAALSAARDVHASLAVFGHYQVVGSNLRVTGQLLDVNTGQALAVLKATDSKQNLFQIEDTIAQQIMAALPPEALTKANGSSGYPTSENPQYTPPSDGGQYAQTQVPNYVPAASDYQPTYDYQPRYEYSDNGDYDYGPYNSGYGYPFYGGIYVYGGYGRYHNGWHHGDGHDGGREDHGANAYHDANAYHGGYVGGSPRSNVGGGGARPSVSGGAHIGGGGGGHIGGGGGAHVGGGGGHAGGGGHR